MIDAIKTSKLDDYTFRVRATTLHEITVIAENRKEALEIFRRIARDAYGKNFETLNWVANPLPKPFYGSLEGGAA